MSRVKAFEFPPDERGSRAILHRARGQAGLVTHVDGDGKVNRQELFLYEDYLVWERGQGVKGGAVAAGALDKVQQAGARSARDVTFDTDAAVTRKRLQSAATAL